MCEFLTTDKTFLSWFDMYNMHTKHWNLLKQILVHFHPHFSPEIFILFAEEKMAKANWGNGRVLVKAFGSYTCWNFAYV